MADKHPNQNVDSDGCGINTDASDDSIASHIEENVANVDSVSEDPSLEGLVLFANIDTMDATDEQKEMYDEMASLYEQNFKTFVRKNMDYGSSFLTSGEIDMVYGDVWENSRQANLYKTFTRIQDKNQRFYNLAFDGGSDHVGEDLQEVALDAANYWMMIAWLSSGVTDE